MIEFVQDVDVTLIEAHASDDMVAMAAWVSHDADSETRLDDRVGVDKLIDFLYRNKHLSPFEHGHFTFKVDVPLFVAREFQRHRTMSYNEVSGRYTLLKPRFYVGSTARVQKGKPGDYFFESGSDEQTAIYLQSKRSAVKRAWKVYNQRIDAGVAKEQAREDLPLSLMTQFYVTVNPRNLMQFLTLRNEKHALKEIRDVAVKMEEIFSQHMPLTYKAYIKQREKQEFDAETAKKKIENLETQLRNAQWRATSAAKEIDNLNIQVSSLQRAKADIEQRFNEVNAAYNGLYVKSKECMPYTLEQVMEMERRIVELTDEVDRLNEERSAPVYNVIVSNGDGLSSEMITEMVNEYQNRRNR